MFSLVGFSLGNGWLFAGKLVLDHLSVLDSSKHTLTFHLGFQQLEVDVLNLICVEVLLEICLHLHSFLRVVS